MAEWFDYSNYHLNRAGGGGTDAETRANVKTNTHRYTRNDIRVAENQFTPQDPFTNSKVMLATNIFIYSNGYIVGMIQSFQASESRPINKLQAIGWEGVVQAVPSNTKGGQLQLSRVALYDSTLYSALGLTTHGVPHNTIGSWIHDQTDETNVTGAVDNSPGWDLSTPISSTDGKTVSSGMVFRTLKDQRVPLEIQVKTRMKGDEDAFYVTTYIDCWLSQYSKPYGVQQIYVTESATLMYGDVY